MALNKCLKKKIPPSPSSENQIGNLPTCTSQIFKDHYQFNIIICCIPYRISFRKAVGYKLSSRTCYMEVVSLMLFIKVTFYRGNPERNIFCSGKNWDESITFLVNEMLKLKIIFFLNDHKVLITALYEKCKCGFFRRTWNVSYCM